MITVEKLEKGTYFDDAFKISFRYDEGDVYPIYLHEMGELEIIQRLVAGILDNKIVVDTNTRINSENDKISIFDLSKKK